MTSMKKVTFTLDADAVRELDRAAERLNVPKSQIVREAVRLYGEQLGRLSDEERDRKLAAFDRVVPEIPEGSRDKVERELAEIGEARRGGGRRSRGA